MARGATARPTKPARRHTVKTYGNGLDELHGHDADDGQGGALEPHLDRVGEREEEAGPQGRHGAPLSEDQRGEREVALARRHVADESGVVGDRQVRAGQPAEHAAQRSSAV